MQAIVYARYSSLEQGRGSSLERQHEICAGYCARQKWKIKEQINDLGTSAWTGANLQTGNLAMLTKRLETEGGTDTVIVVEQLDRISRQPPMKVLEWISRVTATGASLATVNDNLVIDSERLLRDQMTLFSTVFNSFRAYGESQYKSDRISDAWARKRAKDAPLTSRTVAWVELVDGELRLIPARADVVRGIFEMSADGKGAGAIASELNRSGVETFGRSNGWQISYIKKILANRAVIGEFQTGTKPKGGVHKPAGEVRSNYYPAVVSDELFQRVQGRSRHIARASSRKLNNLLSGIAKCGGCGGAMTRLNKTNNWEYLRCEQSRRGLCDRTKNYPLRATVDGILDLLLLRAMDPQTFKSGDNARQLSNGVASAQRLVTDLTARRDRNRKLFELGDDGAADVVLELTKQLDTAKADLKAANAALGRENAAMPASEHLRLVSDVRALMDSADDAVREQARAKVKAALDSIISEVEFNNRIYARARGKEGGARFDESRWTYQDGFIVSLIDGAGFARFDAEATLDTEFDLAKRNGKNSPAIERYVERKDGK